MMTNLVVATKSNLLNPPAAYAAGGYPLVLYFEKGLCSRPFPKYETDRDWREHTMNKKTIAILLIISHLLCILLGYCIAKIQPVKEAELPAEESTTEEVTTEATETPTTEATEEVTEALATEESTEAAEETEETQKPTETVPVYTQPPATNPPATQPPATEPPATQPPATETPATQPPVTENNGGIGGDSNFGSGEEE